MQVNLGSLALLYRVREQITAKLDELAGHVWTKALATTDPVCDLEFDHSAPTAAEATLSRSGVRHLARTDGGPRGDSARYLASLQRAQFDLLVIAQTVSNISLGGAVLTLALSILLARETFLTLPWPWASALPACLTTTHLQVCSCSLRCSDRKSVV